MDRSVIVVGVDYSPASEQALLSAVRAAKSMHAGIELVHALSPLGTPALDPQHPSSDPIDNESADVSASLPRTPEAWLKYVKDAGVPATLVTRPGAPATVLLDEAKRLGARAIFVGSHGRTGIKKAMLGSVAETVLEKSTIPVTVVPGITKGIGAA